MKPTEPAFHKISHRTEIKAEFEKVVYDECDSVLVQILVDQDVSSFLCLPPQRRDIPWGGHI
jgi:hypothetical protein